MALLAPLLVVIVMSSACSNDCDVPCSDGSVLAFELRIHPASGSTLPNAQYDVKVLWDGAGGPADPGATMSRNSVCTASSGYCGDGWTGTFVNSDRTAIVVDIYEDGTVPLPPPPDTVTVTVLENGATVLSKTLHPDYSRGCRPAPQCPHFDGDASMNAAAG